MDGWIDRSKTTQSRGYRGSGSFATFMIIGPTCFFLGILFAQFPYDFPLLWSSAPILPSFYDHLDAHLRFMHQSPPLISRLLHILISVGFLGFTIKLIRPSEANFLFDGASLILYIIGFAVYTANIVKGMRTVSAAPWASDGWEDEVRRSREDAAGDGELLGREDTFRVLAASNTILALVLVGVLVLQSGQWYAERKEIDDLSAEKEASSPTGRSASTKKKS